MAGLFGTMGGLQGAMGGLFGGMGAGMPEPQKAAPRASGGRRGLFGSGIDRDQLQQALLMAQAIAAGDTGAAGQIAMQGQRLRAQQAEAQAEAEREAQAREEYLSMATQALSDRMPKQAIAAMRPEDIGGLLRETYQPRQFGPQGGSVGTPGMDGQMSYQTAPWQQQVGRDIVQGGPNGAAPQIVHRGVEPVSVPDGGALYGMRGDGSIVNPEGAPAMGAPAQDGAPVRVNSPEEARSLPPGTMFQTPDGRTMRVPGGARPSNGAQTFPSGPGWP